MGRKTKLEQFLTVEELESRPMRVDFDDDREYHRAYDKWYRTTGHGSRAKRLNNEYHYETITKVKRQKARLEKNLESG
jgi:hypothetical protein